MIIITIITSILAVFFFIISFQLMQERDYTKQELEEAQNNLLDKDKEIAYWKACFTSMRKERNALLKKFKLW